MPDLPAWSLGRTRRLELAALVGTLVGVAIAAAWMLGQAIPLGWDESVYASRSRSLATDIPTSTWAIYRAPGLPMAGLFGGTFGFTDANLRAVAVAINLVSIVIAWALARMLWGALAATLALLTIVGSPVVIAELALFHTDLPAAGLLLALMLLLWFEFEGRRDPSRLLIAAGPIAALAFYVRYGSILPIGGIAFAAVVLWHRTMLRNRAVVGATVILAAVLFAPHVIEAIARTGSPLGVIASAGEQVDTSEPITTTARYLGWLPSQLAHRLGFAVMLAGVTHAAIVALDAVRRRRLTAAARRHLWLLIPVAVTTVGLVLRSHAEQRYVLFPVLLAIIAGSGAVSAGVAWLRRRLSLADRAATFDVVVLAGILVVAIIAGSVLTRRMVALERAADDSRWQPEVGRAISADAAGACVAATSLPPIIEWYSRCTTVQMTGAHAAAFVARAAHEPAYVLFSHIDERRVSAGTIARYRALVAQGMVVSIPVNGAPPGVEAYRLRP